MQNLLVFCQHCFAWVEPHSQMCPDCGGDTDLNQPDLPRESLAAILGTPLAVLGPVRVERQRLPNYGELVGTSEGLLFLPRLHRRLNGAWEGIASARTPGWWPFRGDNASPRFLEWLRHPLGVKLEPESVADPVAEPSRTSLSDRLMDSPGAFFVEYRVIQSITSRRRTIKLNRSPLRSVTLIDETEEGALHTTLDSLAQKVDR